MTVQVVGRFIDWGVERLNTYIHITGALGHKRRLRKTYVTERLPGKLNESGDYISVQKLRDTVCKGVGFQKDQFYI